MALCVLQARGEVLIDGAASPGLLMLMLSCPPELGPRSQSKRSAALRCLEQSKYHVVAPKSIEQSKGFQMFMPMGSTSNQGISIMGEHGNHDKNKPTLAANFLKGNMNKRTGGQIIQLGGPSLEPH